MKHPHSLLLKLPRHLESDPRKDALEKLLSQNMRLLWKSGTVGVPHVSFSPLLESALLDTLNFHQLERGLERIEQKLNMEKKGLLALQQKQGTPAVFRMSRLLVIANDGAERFNRACETILLHHTERVLGLFVDASSAQLSQKLFGPDKAVKALLVSDKEAVARVLISLL